jgi:hypothetical protein
MAGLLALVGCYEPPKPDCGFRCGPNLACPSDYTCASDNRCHLDGSPTNLNCVTPDSGPGPDAYSPNVHLLFPLQGLDPNPADAVVVEFDVDVAGVDTGSFTVNATGSSLFVVGGVSYDANTHQASFFRSEGLPPLQSLTATLSSDIVDPLSSRTLRVTSFTFTTANDSSPPMVVQTSPVTNSTGNNVGTNLLVRFSEPVIGLSATTFTMFETSMPANTVTGAVSFDFDSRTATFNPVDQLTPNLTYTARISSGVTDAAGNPIFNPPFLMNFMTGADTLQPTVRTTSPLNMDTNVAINTDIQVRFDEPVMGVSATSFQVNGGAVTGVVTMSADRKVATFNPDADLPAATTLNVTLSTAIADDSGNALNAFAFSFTTI